MLTEGELLRFWPKVDVRETDECWPWNAGCTARGYGNFCRERAATRRAHRVMWEAMHGEIPEGLCVLHTCDNPGCVNPLHLFLGTYADNNADMCRKGRGGQARGEAVATSKLNREQVLEIRALAGDVSQRALGRRFGVGKTTVAHIVRRENWGWLEGVG